MEEKKTNESKTKVKIAYHNDLCTFIIFLFNEICSYKYNLGFEHVLYIKYTLL